MTLSLTAPAYVAGTHRLSQGVTFHLLQPIAMRGGNMPSGHARLPKQFRGNCRCDAHDPIHHIWLLHPPTTTPPINPVLWMGLDRAAHPWAWTGLLMLAMQLAPPHPQSL